MSYWTPHGSPAGVQEDLNVDDLATKHSLESGTDTSHATQGLGSPVPSDGKSQVNCVVEIIQELAYRSVLSEKTSDFTLLFNLCQGFNVDASCGHCKALTALRHWVCYNKAFTDDFVRFILNLALPSLDQQPESAYLLAIFASGFYFFNHDYETAERLMASVFRAVVDKGHLLPIQPKINVRMLALFIMRCYIALGGRSDMFAPLRKALDFTSKPFKENRRESTVGMCLSQTESRSGDIHMRKASEEEEKTNQTASASHGSSTAHITGFTSTENCVWDCEGPLRDKYLKERGTASLKIKLIPPSSPLARDKHVPWYLKQVELAERLVESGMGCKLVGMVEGHSVLRIDLSYWDLLE